MRESVLRGPFAQTKIFIIRSIVMKLAHTCKIEDKMGKPS